MDVRTERLTDGHSGPITLFLLGLRVNRWTRPGAWLPVARAMPRMMAELSDHPECGLLGWLPLRIDRRTFAYLQYWRDFEGLNAYAHDPRFAHRPAWQAFNRAMKGGSDAVGIFHETYVVPSGAHESIYFNMPLMGLAKVAGALPATGRREAARDRMAAGHAAP